MTEKEITKFFKRVVKSKTYQTLAEQKGIKQPTLEFMKTVNYNARIVDRQRLVDVFDCNRLVE